MIGLVFFAPMLRTLDGAESLKSPDGRIELSIQIPEQTADNSPHWSATFQGKPVLADCQVGIKAANGGDLLKHAKLVLVNRRSVDRWVKVLFGKADEAPDHYNEIRFTLETTKHQHMDVVFRCSNDAVALRYEVADKEPGSTITITDETTSFHLVGNPTAYAQYLENYKTSHEHNVTTVPYSDLPTDKLLDMPLTFAWPKGPCMAITEAALRHYAGMALMRSSNALSAGLVCKLTPRADGTKVVRPLPMKTPWRVVLLGNDPGALLESNTIYCLNEPSVIEDTSWIKPGKITFHWWNGDVYDGEPGVPMLSFEMNKKYIDFCSREGIPTHSIASTEGVTTPWYQQTKEGVEPGPDTDVTRPRPGFDLAAIHQYASSKNVRLWTWVHQAALRGRVEEAFVAFEKMGWTGMMVDFFDHDDQDNVEFSEEILKAAARHHILIQFHGIWKPTGVQRTYPNLVNHEGALNLEYLKWSDRCTPEHDLKMAFTRLIAGPMDYHLGGFRAVPRSEFKPHPIAPNVLGTRCHQLAMYVCFDNPNPMLADYPTAYEGQPGFDFLKMVPTWWDETKVLQVHIGQLLVTARRKGTRWYLGGLSAGEPRELTLPLSFLGKGEYVANVRRDASDTASNPNHLETETRSVTATQTIKVKIASDGGFVAKISPR